MPRTANAGGLHGRVMGQDPDGHFVELVGGATIEFKNRAGQVAARTQSSPHGYYKVELSPGDYQFAIQADGYRTEDAGRGVRVKHSQGFKVFHLSLTQGENDPDRKPPELPVKKIGRLYGRVLEKAARGEMGIPNAVITLNRVGTIDPVQVISSPGDGNRENVGNYEILLEEGVWRASVSAAGFQRFVDPDPIQIVADQKTERDFVLSRPESDADQGIRGVVTLLEAAKPLPKARLRFVALPGGRQVAEQTISKWGSAPGKRHQQSKYQQRLHRGRFRVVAEAEGYCTATRVVHVLPESYSTANLTLRPLAHDVTVNVVTSSGKPVKDAYVQLALGTVLLREKSDEDGQALFKCRKGRWKVSAQKAPLEQTEPVTVDVGPGLANEATVVLSKPQPFNVLVKVTDPAFKPIGGARVVLRRRAEAIGDAAHGTTNDDGVAEFQVENPGDYTAVAKAEDFVAGGKTFRVTGPETKVHIALRRKNPYVKLNLRILGQQGHSPGAPTTRPVDGASVAIMDGAKTVSKGSSSKDGTFSVRLQAGSYSVRVSHDDYLPAKQTVALTNGIVSREIVLKASAPENYRLNVRVASAVRTGGTRPLSGATVAVYQGTRRVAMGTSGPDGSYSTSLRSDGTFDLQVSKEGYSTHKSRVHMTRDPVDTKIVLRRSVSPQLTLQLQVRDPRGKPISGAMVVISRQFKTVTSGLSDRIGGFERQLSEGLYDIKVSHRGHESAHERVSLKTNTRRTIVLKPSDDGDRPVALELRIVDQRQKPIRGAMIVVSQGRRRVAYGMSDGNGRFDRELSAGRYDVSVSRTGYTAWRGQLQLQSSTRRTIVLKAREYRKARTDDVRISPDAFRRRGESSR